MFETEPPAPKGSIVTMIVAIGAVMAILGGVTWYFTM
jgi:hypothetical protein